MNLVLVRREENVVPANSYWQAPLRPSIQFKPIFGIYFWQFGFKNILFFYYNSFWNQKIDEIMSVIHLFNNKFKNWPHFDDMLK